MPNLVTLNRPRTIQHYCYNNNYSVEGKWGERRKSGGDGKLARGVEWGKAVGIGDILIYLCRHQAAAN